MIAQRHLTAHRDAALQRALGTNIAKHNCGGQISVIVCNGRLALLALIDYATHILHRVSPIHS